MVSLNVLIFSWAALVVSLGQILLASESCLLDDATAYKRRVEAVKAQVLSKLGLTEAPKFNFSDEHLSPEILRTYRAAIMRRKRRSTFASQEDDAETGDHHYYSKPINLIDMKGELVDDRHDYIAIRVDHQHLVKKLEGNLSDVYKAELNMVFTPSHHLDKDRWSAHDVRIELLEKQQQQFPGKVRTKFVDGVDIDLRKRHHIILDVKAVLQRWLLLPCANNTCTLELHVHSIHREEDGAIERFIDGIMPIQAGRRSDGHSERRLTDAHIFVVSHSAVPNAKRLRRRTKRQTLNGEYCRNARARNQANCCLQDLELNFRRDLGWDWVREPEKFKPNHCAGACPYRWSSGSAYSSVISMYNNINPKASAKPCCVADQLGSVTLLFKTGSRQEDARIEELSMMTVQTCKCR